MKTLKFILALPVLSAWGIFSFAQNPAKKGQDIQVPKPPIDTGAFFKWPAVEDPAISNDGKYAFYTIINQPNGSNTLMIQARDKHWELALPGVESLQFTDDSRQVVFIMQGHDSLCLQTLGSDQKKYIPKVRSFKLFMQQGHEWLACQLDDPEKELILVSLSDGKQATYRGVKEYWLSDKGNILVLEVQHAAHTDTGISIQRIDLFSGSSADLWEGKSIKGMTLDHQGRQVAFLSDEQDGTHFLWYYKAGPGKATRLVNDQSAGVDPNLELGGIVDFSKDDRQLFISLKEKKLPPPRPNAIKVDIWSYTDSKLQSQQLNEVHDQKGYLSVINLNGPARILRLQRENEIIRPGNEERNDDFVILTARLGESAEYYWSRAALGATFLVSTATGDRKVLFMHYAAISTNGKYVVGYGPGESLRDLFCYEIATGITRNLTASLPIPLYAWNWDRPLTLHIRGLSTGPWLTDDTAILVYDEYDIWKIDPSGKTAAVNLTDGYGRRNDMVFRIVDDPNNIAGENYLIISAFNKRNKSNGFYRMSIDKKGQPTLLTMGPYAFCAPSVGLGKSPLKARDTAVYLVSRQQSNCSPNLFWTADFKSYQPLSQVNPENTVNWYHSELINFTASFGTKTQAILYKPGDFDPSKKYPLIVNYYEQKSDNLNRYWAPVIDNGGELDIAWFVSHGYLVLLTNIHFKASEPGESVLKSVTAAAKYLSGFPWVDNKHIGIQGHSFGGYETNYLVTHSRLFAAAISSCGVSDVTSEYSSLWARGESKQEYWETRDGRLGTTPWDHPGIYVKNSPIFYVGNVTTPILMMANKNDANVHFEQGLEFFTALRRAGKRAWMLQYDNGGHGVGGDDYKDYIIRSTQFFDHYLKGAPAPKWMVEGIPAAMKGVDDGLGLSSEVDANGKPITPGPGLLTPEEQKKVDKLMKRKPITIKL